MINRLQLCSHSLTVILGVELHKRTAKHLLCKWKSFPFSWCTALLFLLYITHFICSLKFYTCDKYSLLRKEFSTHSQRCSTELQFLKASRTFHNCTVRNALSTKLHIFMFSLLHTAFSTHISQRSSTERQEGKSERATRANRSRRSLSTVKSDKSKERKSNPNQVDLKIP